MNTATGDALRRARLEQERGVADAAAELGIEEQYLDALEDGRITAITKPVVARGYLRMYARYLGLDAERLLRGESARQAPTSTTPAFPKPVTPRPARPLGRPLGPTAGRTSEATWGIPGTSASPPDASPPDASPPAASPATPAADSDSEAAADARSAGPPGLPPPPGVPRVDPPATPTGELASIARRTDDATAPDGPPRDLPPLQARTRPPEWATSGPHAGSGVADPAAPSHHREEKEDTNGNGAGDGPASTSPFARLQEPSVPTGNDGEPPDTRDDLDEYTPVHSLPGLGWIVGFVGVGIILGFLLAQGLQSPARSTQEIQAPAGGPAFDPQEVAVEPTPTPTPSPTPQQTVAPTPAVDALPPEETSVQVLNGARDTSLYEDAIAFLEDLGYTVVRSGPTRQPFAETLLLFNDGFEAEADALQARDDRLPEPEVNDRDLSAQMTLHLIVGQDWVATAEDA